MSKKRNRQPDANAGEPSEGSTESCEDIIAAGKCSHISNAISLNKIKKYLRETGIANHCLACNKIDGAASNPDGEVTCKPKSTLWICLQCGSQGCGRNDNGHALEHFRKPHSDCHFLVANTHQWTVWCYKCEAEIGTACSKKLLETMEFIKRSTDIVSYNPPQSKKALAQAQRKANVDIDKDKENLLSTLPKVGGLANLGNTCFFNAVLQCLAQTPFLVKVLDDLRLPGQKFILPGGKHKPGNSGEEVDLPPIEGTLEKWGSFTATLYKTLTEMQSTNGNQVYNPSELLSSFKMKSMQCMDGGQHDSHELLRHLLELVRCEDLRRYQSIILKEVGLSEKTNPTGVEDSLKSRIKFYGNQASALLLGPQLVFRGVLVTTLECLDCNHSSQSTEPFLDLSLPVMADKPQPPILKRKTSGHEESYDVIVDSALLAPWRPRRNQRRRGRDKQEGDEASLAKQNTDVNSYIVLESEERDADIEDNVEGDAPPPEIGESGYSSEKPSALASPVSPTAGDPINVEDVTTNNGSMDNGLQKVEAGLLQQHLFQAFCSSPGSATASMALVPFEQNAFGRHNIPQDHHRDDPEVQDGTALPNSLAWNSDPTSPQDPTASFSYVTPKDNPSNCSKVLTNGEVTFEPPYEPSRLNLVEANVELDVTPKVAPNVEDKENGVLDDKMAWRSAIKARVRASDSVGTLGAVCNGVNGITSGITQLGIGGHVQQSPTRFVTKEGECMIQSCLNQFTALELMSGSNKVGCEACTARERKVKEGCKMVCTTSTKQYLISRVPAVLILHLKRFQSQRVDFRKVTKYVSFPLLLDLAPVCKGHRESRVYALYGVVEHKGTIHGGHYVAYVKTRQPLQPEDPRWSFLPRRDAKDTDEYSGATSASCSDSELEGPTAANLIPSEGPPGKWYYVSDSRVSEVDETTVLQTQAYLLFYERIL